MLLKLLKILNPNFQGNNFHKVFRNTSYLFISEILIKVLGVFWVIYLAHSFTVLNYGVYNYVTSLIAIFSFLPDFGVGLIVIREIARDKKKSPLYLGNSFILNGALAGVTFIILLFFAALTGAKTGIFPYIILAGITLFFSTIRSVSIFYFDGQEKMQYSALLNLINTFFLIVCAALGVFLGFGLMGVFGGMLTGTLISLVISWSVLLRFVKPKFVYSKKTVMFYLFQGAPLGIAAFASLIYTRVDVLVLSGFLGDSAVGIYSAATPFAFALVQLLNVPFVVAVYPTLARLHKEDKKRFQKGLLKSLLATAIWSFPASLLIALTSWFLIPLIFGHKYDTAIPILQVLIFFVPFMCLSALLYKILIILHHQKDYLYISIGGAVLNLLLNVILIPMYGILGAAASAVITQIILAAVYGGDVYIRIREKRRGS